MPTIPIVPVTLRRRTATVVRPQSQNYDGRVIAVDFDGVIHDDKHPAEGRRMGPPMPGAIEGMRRLARHATIVIFTARGDSPEHVEEWLRFYGIPFDHVTNVKGRFDRIIDDRAERFTSWEHVNAD